MVSLICWDFCSGCSDLRARLEVAITKVIKLQKEFAENETEDTDYHSDTEDVIQLRNT